MEVTVGTQEGMETSDAREVSRAVQRPAWLEI